MGNKKKSKRAPGSQAGRRQTTVEDEFREGGAVPAPPKPGEALNMSYSKISDFGVDGVHGSLVLYWENHYQNSQQLAVDSFLRPPSHRPGSLFRRHAPLEDTLQGLIAAAFDSGPTDGMKFVQLAMVLHCSYKSWRVPMLTPEDLFQLQNTLPPLGALGRRPPVSCGGEQCDPNHITCRLRWAVEEWPALYNQWFMNRCYARANPAGAIPDGQGDPRVMALVGTRKWDLFASRLHDGGQPTLETPPPGTHDHIATPFRELTSSLDFAKFLALGDTQGLQTPGAAAFFEAVFFLGQAARRGHICPLAVFMAPQLKKVLNADGRTTLLGRDINIISGLSDFLNTPDIHDARVRSFMTSVPGAVGGDSRPIAELAADADRAVDEATRWYDEGRLAESCRRCSVALASLEQVPAPHPTILSRRAALHHRRALAYVADARPMMTNSYRRMDYVRRALHDTRRGNVLCRLVRDVTPELKRGLVICGVEADKLRRETEDAIKSFESDLTTRRGAARSPRNVSAMSRPNTAPAATATASEHSHDGTQDEAGSDGGGGVETELPRGVLEVHGTHVARVTTAISLMEGLDGVYNGGGGDCCPNCIEDWSALGPRVVVVQKCGHAICARCLAEMAACTQDGNLNRSHAEQCAYKCGSPRSASEVRSMIREVAAMSIPHMGSLSRLTARLGRAVPGVDVESVLTDVLVEARMDVEVAGRRLYEMVSRTVTPPQASPSESSLKPDDKEKIYQEARAVVRSLEDELREKKRMLGMRHDDVEQLQREIEEIHGRLNHARADAAENIYRKMNRGVDFGGETGQGVVMLDLHGLHVSEAQRVITETVIPLLPACKGVVVVVGAGCHSKTNTPTLRNAVISAIEGINDGRITCRIDPKNPGRVMISCKD